MMDLPEIPPQWGSAIFAALLGTLGVIARGQKKQMSDLQTDVKTLASTQAAMMLTQQNHVTKDSLTAALSALDTKVTAALALQDERTDARHLSNENNFREIRLQNESTNSKLFEIASKMK